MLPSTCIGNKHSWFKNGSRIMPNLVQDQWGLESWVKLSHRSVHKNQNIIDVKLDSPQRESSSSLSSSQSLSPSHIQLFEIHVPFITHLNWDFEQLAGVFPTADSEAFPFLDPVLLWLPSEKKRSIVIVIAGPFNVFYKLIMNHELVGSSVGFLVRAVGEPWNIKIGLWLPIAMNI